MSAHTCDHGVWIGYKCCRCGGRALRKTRPTFTPPPLRQPKSPNTKDQDHVL